jgi:hypothetical protein
MNTFLLTRDSKRRLVYIQGLMEGLRLQGHSRTPDYRRAGRIRIEVLLFDRTWGNNAV